MLFKLFLLCLLHRFHKLKSFAKLAYLLVELSVLLLKIENLLLVCLHKHVFLDNYRLFHGMFTLGTKSFFYCLKVLPILLQLILKIGYLSLFLGYH